MPYHRRSNSLLAVGDLVSVPTRPSWGECEVIDTADPSLVTIRTNDGGTPRVGRAAIVAIADATTTPNRA